MTFLIWILTSLASFRLALMFSKEEGPGSIFKSIRQWSGLNATVRDGIECLLCESVWWAGLFTVYLGILGVIPWGLSPIFWLACSATACIIHFQFTDKEP